MNDSIFRRWIVIILIIAALGRIGFLLFGEVLPVMWDARRYVGASIGLISYFDQPDSNLYQSNPKLDKEQYLTYSDKYIQGEQIEWLYYQKFSLSEARNEIFIAGPTYPLLMGAIMMITPTADFTVIRIVNIIIDILSLLLLILITTRLINKKTALIAGMIYALYLPFVILCSQLLLEGTTTFLIMASVYALLKAGEKESNKLYLLAGLCSGLLILNKPTAAFLFVPLIIWWGIKHYKIIPAKKLTRQIVLFLVPVMVIFIGWSSIVAAKYGSFSLRDPSYSKANLRSSSNINFEGYDLDKVESDFWSYSIKDHILNNPVGYTGLLAKKMERLWSSPANDFKQYFIIPNNYWSMIHKLLILFSLIGLSWLLIVNFKNAVLLLLIAGYYSAIHILFHSLSRYSLNVLPLLFIAAAFILYRLSESISLKNYQLIKWLAIFLISLYLDYHILSSVLNLTLSITLVVTSIIIKLLVIFYSVYKIGRLLFPEKKKWAYAVAPIVIVLAISNYTYSIDLSRGQWAEYQVQHSPGTIANNRIFISDFEQPAPNELFAAVIDLNSPPNGSQSFVLHFEGSTQQFTLGQKPLSDFFYPKATYKIFAKYQKLPLSHYRQYAIILLDPKIVRNQLENKGYVDLGLSLNQNSNLDNNIINLYGNYNINSDSSFIPAVRFTSIERYRHKNDPRIRYPVKFSSDNAISYYIKDDKNKIYPESGFDSESLNKSGRFNMFLIHFYPDGNYRVY